VAPGGAEYDSASDIARRIYLLFEKKPRLTEAYQVKTSYKKETALLE